MEQTELFYFAKNDLMVKVLYDKLESVASYKCHRVMLKHETELIEKYIEFKILESQRSVIFYNGEDDELQKTWDEFHSTKSMKPDDDLTDIWNKGSEHKIMLPGLELKDKFKDHYKKVIKDSFSDKKKLLENLQNLQGALIEGISTKMIIELKAGADKGFCFDRIGDILRDRNENHKDEPEHRMEELEMYLKEYNKLTNKTITLKSLLK